MPTAAPTPTPAEVFRKSRRLVMSRCLRKIRQPVEDPLRFRPAMHPRRAASFICRGCRSRLSGGSQQGLAVFLVHRGLYGRLLALEP